MIGEFETTMLHSFCRGSIFRQWLLQAGMPDLVKQCQRLLDHAYGFSDADDSEDDAQEIRGKKHQRVRAPRPGRGFYTTPAQAGAGEGNAYICFYPEGDRGAEWAAGHIQKITDKNGQLTFLVQCFPDCYSKDTGHAMQDPFKQYWKDGFEAKMVQCIPLPRVAKVPIDWVIGHTAHWEVSQDAKVVLRVTE